jgi:hypothetical protein
MLNLLREVSEVNFGVIERELRCGIWSWNLRTDEMQWSKGLYELMGIETGKVAPSFAAMLQVTHPDDRGPQAEVERVIRDASTILCRERGRTRVALSSAQRTLFAVARVNA